MAIPHARSGEVVPLIPDTGTPEHSQTRTLIKTDSLEAIRMVLPAGKEIQKHKARGDITIQCLEGNVEFLIEGDISKLVPGTLLFLNAGVPHAVRALEDSVLLLSLCLVSKSP